MTMSAFNLPAHRGIMRIVLTVSAILLFAGLVGSVAATDYNVAYGETVKLHVSNPFGGTAYFYIQGTNFPFAPLKDSSGDQLTVSGRGVRTVELETSNINGRHPDVGTYTIYVSNKQGATSPNNLASSNGYWDSYSLTLRPIGLSVSAGSSSPAVATSAPTVVATPVPTPEPTPEPTSIPATPAPFIGLIAGIGLVVLVLRR